MQANDFWECGSNVHEGTPHYNISYEVVRENLFAESESEYETPAVGAPEAFDTAWWDSHFAEEDARLEFNNRMASDEPSVGKDSLPAWQRCDTTGFLGPSSRRESGTSGSPSVTERLGFRFRKRGRLTNGLSKAFAQILNASSIEVGGKSSLMGVKLWIKAIELAGIKVVDLHRVGLTEGSEDWFLTLTQNDRSVVISLDVFAKIQSYATFRPRTSDLLLALRTRAVQRAKEIGLDNKVIPFILPGTVALAMHVLPAEMNAFEFLGGELGVSSDRFNLALVDGEVPSAYDSVALPLLAPKHSWADWFLSVASGGHNVRQGRKLTAASR